MPITSSPVTITRPASTIPGQQIVISPDEKICIALDDSERKLVIAGVKAPVRRPDTGELVDPSTLPAGIPVAYKFKWTVYSGSTYDAAGDYTQAKFQTDAWAALNALVAAQTH